MFQFVSLDSKVIHSTRRNNGKGRTVWAVLLTCLEKIYFGGTSLEVTSFGTLSKLFCNLSDNRVKKQITRQYNLPQHQVLESWVKCIVILRNCLARHARIWNRRFPQMSQMASLRLRGAWIDCSRIRPNKLYAQLCCLAYLQDSIHPDNDFKNQIKSLLNEYSQINLHNMGFPADWESEPLWR